jgi:glutamate-1-semialdehyde 2,1-aminomutase
MSQTRIPGVTSTGSKRPEALFGAAELRTDGLPGRMIRSSGCRVWDQEGREYTDFIMGLGAVALGYGHPLVNRAAEAAIAAGTVGPLAPVLEEQLADDLCRAIPWLERVLFLKTGAEAVAAAVRLARVITRRESVLGCGYHGWLDWCQRAEGVPVSTLELYAELPFNDSERSREMIRSAGRHLAAVIVEPVVVEEPRVEWLQTLREETARAGAVLIYDEIKTAFRLAIGGAAERYGIRPDLMVLGKAMGNGFPISAVAGRAEVMEGATQTWISSTLATEMVSLAAARATVGVMVTDRVPERLAKNGVRLVAGLRRLRQQHSELVSGVGGVPEMCFLQYRDEDVSRAVAVGCARRGLLFKRTAYNFVSLAHDEAVIDGALEVLHGVLGTIR